MTNEEAIKIIDTEKACVKRGVNCDRDCGKCDLVMETADILEAYDIAIKALGSWEQYSDELWKKAYARGYNDAKIQIAESGEYERAYQRGYDDGRKSEWTAAADMRGEDVDD